MGKRLHAPFFVAGDRRARRRGLLLPAHRRRRHEPGAGVRDGVLGLRLRRLRLPARHGHAAPRALAGAAPRWWSPTSSGRTARPVVASPRQILRRQLERLAERGWTANIGSELEFILFRDSYDEARASATTTSTPANPYNVDYSIFGTTVVEDVIRPIRLGHGGRRHRGRGLEGRVQLRPARGQLPLLRRADDGRQPRDLQERRQGDRLAARAPRSRSWPSTTSARATRATSTARSGTATGACSRRRRARHAAPTVRALHRRAAGRTPPS